MRRSGEDLIALASVPVRCSDTIAARSVKRERVSLPRPRSTRFVWRRESCFTNLPQPLFSLCFVTCSGSLAND